MDAGVGAAPAQVGDGCVDILISGIWLVLDQDRRRHDHPGLAKSALRQIFCNPCLLDRVTTIARQAFDGRDETALNRFDGDCAGPHGPAINIYGACAAIAITAAVFGAGEV